MKPGDGDKETFCFGSKELEVVFILTVVELDVSENSLGLKGFISILPTFRSDRDLEQSPICS